MHKTSKFHPRNEKNIANSVSSLLYIFILQPCLDLYVSAQIKAFFIYLSLLVLRENFVGIEIASVSADLVLKFETKIT